MTIVSVVTKVEDQPNGEVKVERRGPMVPAVVVIAKGGRGRTGGIDPVGRATVDVAVAAARGVGAAAGDGAARAGARGGAGRDLDLLLLRRRRLPLPAEAVAAAHHRHPPPATGRREGPTSPRSARLPMPVFLPNWPPGGKPSKSGRSEEPPAERLGSRNGSVTPPRRIRSTIPTLPKPLRGRRGRKRPPRLLLWPLLLLRLLRLLMLQQQPPPRVVASRARTSRITYSPKLTR
mmetsp:Transcript_4310/g.9339  ORF Transcript_4310/g.9339 Transcript_4310/m.9339 type:complete len:234 (-) Transcript_4310:2100-2801(-)